MSNKSHPPQGSNENYLWKAVSTSSGGPSSNIIPSLREITLSHISKVESLCAIIITVIAEEDERIDSITILSVLRSSALVASSRTRNFDSL